MNKQRNVLITTTYNEMGIIIDTKAEELGSSAQPEPCEIEQYVETCEECGFCDTISRQAALDIFDDYNVAVENGQIEAYSRDRKRLCNLPPVTPKQRTGHWIPVGVAEVVGGESAMWGSAVAYHKCSECDGQALGDDFEQEVLSKWCPHCGAKMEGVDDE